MRQSVRMIAGRGLSLVGACAAGLFCLETAKFVGLGCLWWGASGCAQRGFTKPRSQIIEESRSDGLPVKSAEEERQEFFRGEELQRQRLMSLIRKRSGGEYRDVNYRFGPDDEIELNVFDVPELNVTAKVRASGFVSLPLVGAVKAGGLTEAEFHDQLKKRLASYVRNPEISIFISNYGSQKVAVMGAVRNPGSIALKKGSNSLLELLSQAGGVSDKAGNFMIFIPAELSGVTGNNDVEDRARLALTSDRLTGVRETGIEVYLDQVLGTGGGIPLEIPIRGGDMIIVPEAGKIMVEGEVEKPGSFDLSQQMTLLGALAASGGITYGAKIDEIEVVREASVDQKTRLVLDLEKIGAGEEKDVRLRNGDIVRVPSDSSRRLRQDTFEGITKLINFGVGGSVNLAK